MKESSIKKGHIAVKSTGNIALFMFICPSLTINLLEYLPYIEGCNTYLNLLVLFMWPRQQHKLLQKNYEPIGGYE
jgi:hypothetical protein